MAQRRTSQSNPSDTVVSELTSGVNAIDISGGSGADTSSVEDTVAEMEASIKQLPEHPQRCVLLDALARTRLVAFWDDGEVKHLDAAIQDYLTALDLQPMEVAYRSNISNCFILRFQKEGRRNDLEDAAKHYRSAIRIISPIHYARASIFKNAAAAFLLCFTSWQREADLDDAIVCLQEVMRLNNIDGADMPVDLCELGDCLLRRFRVSLRMADLDEAVVCYRRALPNLPSGDPSRTPCLNNLASSLVERFRVSGDPPDIDDAIAFFTEALASEDSSHPDRPSSLNDLATAFRLRYKSSGNTEDLDESFERQKEALRLTPLDDPHRAARLSNFALCLLRRFQQSGAIADLEESISSYREVLPLQLPNDPDRTISLNDLATALCSRFEVRQSIPDLDEAISLCKEAALLCPDTHPDRALFLENLGKSLRARFSLLNNEKDLQEAIEQQRNLLHFYPPGSIHRSSCLIQLGDDLSSRFTILDHIQDLDSAIASYKEAGSISDHDSALCTEKLAAALLARFRKSGEASDLDETIELHKNQLSVSSITDEDRPTLLITLSYAFLRRFYLLEKVNDLEEAVLCDEEALRLISVGSSARASYLTMLYVVLRARFEKLGQIDDLERATECQREALQLLPSGIPNRPTSLQSLSEALVLRFERLHHKIDIDEAITLCRESLSICPPQAPERALLVLSLSKALRSRFLGLRQAVDIEEAVALSREAVLLNSGHHCELAINLFHQFRSSGEIQCLDESISHFREAQVHDPPSHSNQLPIFHNLTTTLGARFRYSGDISYLEDAIIYARNALDLRPSAHQNSGFPLGHLADCLMMRYEHSGQRPDLENAISLYRQAHVLFRDSDPERAPILMNMAHSLVTSFRKFNELRDLEEGLSHYRSALEISDSAVRPVCLSNLANALRVRFHETGQLSDVDEATGYYREALHLCSPQHPDRNMYLINFGTTLLSRFLRTTEEADLDEAIRHLEEAEDDLPAHDPLHALSQFNLGTASWNKYQIARDETELRRALALLESAARLPFSSAKARFEAALQWSVISHSQQHPSTIQAYSCALDLLEKWVIVNPAIEAQHRFLATDQSQNLACDGASAAIDRGDLEAAVELLEHGRTVLWSRLQGYRQTLDELRIKDSGLVDRFESLSKELEDLSLRSEAKITPLLDPVSRVSDDTMKTQRILSEQWEEVVSQIRRTEGFAHFLQPTPFSVLQQASSEGPVILVNLSRFRSDAVVILVDRAPILVPLPNATPETMFHLYTQLDAGLKSRDGVSGGTSQLVSTVRLLWVNVVQPVVSQLQALGVPERSRIWWCPTSYMCGLPLHAAGSYSRSNPQPSFCDLFVSSYTPTLAALLRARNSTPRVAAPEILVVGQPGRDLPSVEQEIQEVVRLGPFVRTLLGEDASRDRVATSLEEYPWVHFACHAKQDPLPFQSSFELYDGQLTLLDLVRSHRVGGGLAFLSACNTATGDSETPNENLHLAAALQFSGFQSVVGTLWPMADSDGPAIAREFYQHLFQMGQDRANARDSAVALSYATKYLRRSGVPLDRWINFVHIGA